MVTSEISRSAGVQFFEGVHIGKVCVHVFIKVSVCVMTRSNLCWKLLLCTTASFQWWPDSDWHVGHTLVTSNPNYTAEKLVHIGRQRQPTDQPTYSPAAANLCGSLSLWWCLLFPASDPFNSPLPNAARAAAASGSADLAAAIAVPAWLGSGGRGGSGRWCSGGTAAGPGLGAGGTPSAAGRPAARCASSSSATQVSQSVCPYLTTWIAVANLASFSRARLIGILNLVRLDYIGSRANQESALWLRGFTDAFMQFSVHLMTSCLWFYSIVLTSKPNSDTFRGLVWFTWMSKACNS
jgi:hypothetical protein